MKYKRTKAGCLVVCLVCGWLSCKEETLLPDLEGNLVGYVYTFDEFASPKEDHHGVLVTAYGVAHINQTQTDANGRFEFRQLPAGTYELQMEKAGYATMKAFGVQHLGGKPTTLGLNFSSSTNCEAFFLYELPTTLIIELSVENDTLYGEFNFSDGHPEYVPLRIYLSDRPNFTSSDAVKVIERTLNYSNSKFWCPIWSEDFPFQSGETVYFRGAVFFRTNLVIFNRIIVGIDSYFDADNNQTVYPNLGNESEQFSYTFRK